MWTDWNMRKNLSERKRGSLTTRYGTQNYLDSAPFGHSGSYRSYTGSDDRLWLLGVLVIISVLGVVYLVGALL